MHLTDLWQTSPAQAEAHEKSAIRSQISRTLPSCMVSPRYACRIAQPPLTILHDIHTYLPLYISKSCVSSLHFSAIHPAGAGVRAIVRTKTTTVACTVQPLKSFHPPFARRCLRLTSRPPEVYKEDSCGRWIYLRVGRRRSSMPSHNDGWTKMTTLVSDDKARAHPTTGNSTTTKTAAYEPVATVGVELVDSATTDSSAGGCRAVSSSDGGTMGHGEQQQQGLEHENEHGEYRVYRRRWFGLAQLVILNIIVSWDVRTFYPFLCIFVARRRVLMLRGICAVVDLLPRVENVLAILQRQRRVDQLVEHGVHVCILRG